MKLLFSTFSLASILFLTSCQEKKETPAEPTPKKIEQSYIQHDPTAHHQIALEVLNASKQWINAFNTGNSDYCVAAYLEDAVMRATPFGLSTGTDKIGEFWKPFVASGATNLIYTNVAIEVVNATTALLSANWSMNVGEGIIYQEKWVKKGTDWKLAYDDFEVVQKYDTPKTKDLDPIASHKVLEEVIKASIQWTKGFNSQNSAICGNGYTANATMNAVPFASVHDQKSITEFWDNLIQQGAKNLIYHTPKFEAITSNRVKLSSQWSMNIGEGSIYQEKWIQKDGQWLLEYDEFEVLKKY